MGFGLLHAADCLAVRANAMSGAGRHPSCRRGSPDSEVCIVGYRMFLLTLAFAGCDAPITGSG